MPENPRRKRNVAADVASVVALLVAAGVTGVLLLIALFVAACESGGECADEGGTPLWGLLVTAGVVFLGVPGLVAGLRRDPRWLLVPLVEGAVLLLAVGATGFGRV